MLPLPRLGLVFLSCQEKFLVLVWNWGTRALCRKSKIMHNSTAVEHAYLCCVSAQSWLDQSWIMLSIFQDGWERIEQEGEHSFLRLLPLSPIWRSYLQHLCTMVNCHPHLKISPVIITKSEAGWICRMVIPFTERTTDTMSFLCFILNLWWS